MKQQKNETEGITEWVLSGEKGAVNFLVFPVPEGGWLRSCCIGTHSLRGRKEDCDVLPGGKCHQAYSERHGLELWMKSRMGNDETKIWAELAQWYRQL